MTICTAPGCGQPATLQWQRAATQIEADHAVNDAGDTQDRIHQHRLTNATLHLLDTRRQHEDATQAAQAGDQLAANVLPALAARVTAAEAHVDQLTQAGPDVLPHPGVVLVPVFGCEQHAVTGDAATWTHQAGCLTDPPGQCTCPTSQE